MKKIIVLTSIVAMASIFSGCATSVRDNVPATEITGSLNGKPFSFTGPKDLVMTNFLAEVDTNGSARVSIGYINASVDPNVITMTGQAYSTMRAADSALLNSAISTAASAAGTIGGAAVKAP